MHHRRQAPLRRARDHPYRQFAEACGYELSVYEVVRHLELPVPDERIQEWIDSAAPRHEGYTIETFVGAVPDDLVESLCMLIGQLTVDAPTGVVDFEEEVITPQRYAEMLEGVAAMDRVRFETVALTPDSRSSLSPPGDAPRRGPRCRLPVGHLRSPRAPRPPSRHGHQGGQPARAAGRPRRPDPVVTQNAETNDYMVAINDRMGFHPVEVSAEFVKRL